MGVYDISIASTGQTGDGFIDYLSVYDYMNANPADIPTNLAASVKKSHALRRNKNVVLSIQFYSALAINSVTTTGSPSTNAAPTTIVYRVEGDKTLVTTPDETSPGTTLTGDAAIKRIVSRAMVKAETIGMDIYDPTTATAPGNTTLWARTGPTFSASTVGALFSGSLTTAAAAITITTVS